jgi:hypothetical protein
MNQTSPCTQTAPEVAAAIRAFTDYLLEIWNTEERFGQITIKCNPTEIHVERTSSRRFRSKPPVPR